MAFMDDIYVSIAHPERVAEVCPELELELWRHARISVHAGKTHVERCR